MNSMLPQTWQSNILSNESGVLSCWFEHSLNFLLANQIAWSELYLLYNSALHRASQCIKTCFLSSALLDCYSVQLLSPLLTAVGSTVYPSPMVNIVNCTFCAICALWWLSSDTLVRYEVVIDLWWSGSVFCVNTQWVMDHILLCPYSTSKSSERMCLHYLCHNAGLSNFDTVPWKILIFYTIFFLYLGQSCC